MEDEFIINGLIAIADGNNDTAIDQLSKSIEKGENAYKAYFYRAIAYLNKGNFTTSLEDLATAEPLRKEDEMDDFYYIKGKVLFYNQDIDKAKENLQKAIAVNGISDESKEKINKFIDRLNQSYI